MNTENLLGKETSPYLQQHASNPMNWMPYSDEAFELAKATNKPVFISIGYSSCHWCHVMARESFSDPEMAAFMNENFINVKIDREEYPGVDRTYQEIYQMLYQRGGGWPLSVFTNAEGTPFFMGTYFPKVKSYGMNSFSEICNLVMNAWDTKQDDIAQQASQIKEGIVRLNQYLTEVPGELSEEMYQEQVKLIQGRFDHKYGGIGSAPKFPRIATFRYLLQEGHNSKNDAVTDFVKFTFHRMSQGGIYDQLGGGFARYSVDKEWLVPHFEKMLYDNAGLIQLGADLYTSLKDKFAQWVVFDTISWLAREMTSPEGGFYSTLNADSEGVEGKYYVWTMDQIKETLCDTKTEAATLRYELTEKGNFFDPHHSELTGMNVLSVKKSISEMMGILELSENDTVALLNEVRQELFKERVSRIAPSRDTKIIVSWNSLMIKALFIAAESLNLETAGQLALNAINFIIDNLIEEDRLLHSYHKLGEDQVDRKIEGVLDDYSFTISALIHAFEYTDDWKYIKVADKLMDMVHIKFYNSIEHVYYVNPIDLDNQDLFSKVLQPTDDSMASGLGMLVSNLFKLSKYLVKPDLEKKARLLVERFAGRFNESVASMNEMMISATALIRYPTEIVMVGSDEDLSKSYFGSYLPNRLIYRWNENNKDDGRPSWDVLEGRTEVDIPTVYICKGQMCSLPLTDSDSVSEELSK